MGSRQLEPVTLPFSSPDELEQYLPYLIARLAHRWRQNQDQELSPLDIKGTNMRLLSCLSAFGELTIGELSILAVTEQSSVSRAVEQLVVSGLAERNVSKLDQRVRTVVLSPKGTEKLAEVATVINPLYSALTEDIDRDDLQTCISVLQQILAQTRENSI
ncbi:MarR family winged helix-turn-helix transcriptional regulator [Sulfitobacter sp. F26169L]|uniref:MarR family winged helix-turn-helix transcriptional regulator n=1 Tax=Sulfitobacter sp. F26169L TaxID=2996015 RepID=UPI002260F5E9|nr:MarR family winged helix-turn-helix transcriptional regulator [Sulfitobacter sp. F26169L]MCX7565977.1 MarR family winged helix-turn-helix transcriptional regulator [Sulfitobacter sp. F26169L]